MTGVGLLLRAALRRDRWLLLWWTVGIVVLYVSQAYGTRATYGSQAELDRAAQSEVGNPALIALAGPPRALDTVGGQTAWQAAAFGCIAIGLLMMLLVGRHTRSEEESGRDELVRTAAVGRTAPTAAAIGLAVLADVVVALLVIGALVGYGLPIAGSAALGLGLAGCGVVFAAVALVSAQVAGSARGVYGLTGLVIGITFVLRAVGDVGPGWLSWCSPIGWGQAMRPFAGERWWPAALFVPAALALGAIALVLLARRDAGSGLLVDRPGPAEGRLGAWGLPWRLAEGPVVGWALGSLALGGVLGSLGDSIGDLVGDGRVARDVLGVDPSRVVDSFHATSLLLTSLLAAGLAISLAMRPRGDELDGRAELVLAASGSRLRWWAGDVVVTVAGAVLVVGLGGLGLGAGYAATTGDVGAIGRLALDAVSYAPAPLLLAAVTTALLGWVPRLLPVAWAALAACVAVLLLGGLSTMPEAVLDVSPFHALAQVPLESWRALPFAVVLLVGFALAAIGWLGLRRRDLGR